MTSHSRHSVTATGVPAVPHTDSSRRGHRSNTRHQPDCGRVTTDLPSTHTALTVSEVMGALHLSRFKVYDLIRSGELRSFTVGRSRRIPAEALRAFIETRTREAA